MSNPFVAARSPSAPLAPAPVKEPVSGTMQVDIVASLRAEIVDLRDRLRCAEGEVGRLRAAAAAAGPSPLVVLPSEALRAAAVPLRFSSIPVGLRTSGRKMALKVGVTLGLLLLVAGFVALSVLSRTHVI
jgi:hypothetical protein